jgi:hypothetical protein
MADNKMSFSTLTTKQKVIGVLTVVIFGFIIYEVIGMFSSGKPVGPTITPTASSSPPKRMSATIPAPPGVASPQTMQASAQPPGQAGSLTTFSPLTAPKESGDLQKQEQEQQQTYLDSVNQLQLLKIKREIAETNQAIASARLATETANKSMSDLLTQPSLPQIPGGNVPKNISGTAPGSLQGADNAPPIKAPVLDIPFIVVSVSMRFNHWNAILGYEGKYYSVAIGDTLFDGSVVAAIYKNGVTLIKDGKRRKVSIQTTI